MTNTLDTTNPTNTVVGLFDDRTEAERAVRDLVDAGVPREDIGLTSNNANGEITTTDAGADSGDRTASGAAAGAGIGAALGGIGGLLVGFGALTIPGIGPLLAAGPLAAALAGIGIGAAAGGLLGALTGLGIPEEDAHAYAEGVRRGGTLVTVNTDNVRTDTVADILNRHGAVDIDRRSDEWRQRGWTGFRHDAAPMSTHDIAQERSSVSRGAGQTQLAPGKEGEIRVPVTREELAVGKRPVQRGGVRVYQRVQEKPVTETVPLREEHVTVDRRPVDRPVTAGDRSAFQERSYEVREVAEEPVVEKRARVAEEVVIRKDVDQRVETVNDTVRRTDVDVQRLGGNDYSTYDDDFRRDFTSRYAGQGTTYDTYSPAYRFGYDLGTDPRYAGRDWDAIETEARADWDRRGVGPWDRFKESVRYAWDRARGRRLDRAA